MNLPVKRELTEKQELFLNKLFENGGNISKATVDSGYSKYSRKWLSKTLRQEIINRCETELATHGPKAVHRLKQTMDDDGSNIKTSELRMKAAESILNRVGLGKKETIDHNVRAIHGIVVLPPKKND